MVKTFPKSRFLKTRMNIRKIAATDADKFPGTLGKDF